MLHLHLSVNGVGYDGVYKMKAGNVRQKMIILGISSF